MSEYSVLGSASVTAYEVYVVAETAGERIYRVPLSRLITTALVAVAPKSSVSVPLPPSMKSLPYVPLAEAEEEIRGPTPRDHVVECAAVRVLDRHRTE